MIAATMFSGIGAPECAMPHWSFPWHAEIEKFPSAVMSARHPRSVNLGDVTAHDFLQRARSIAVPDVLVFGSPCQDFSVAGRRQGMDGKRGNLSMVALGILGRLRPRWFCFENVPGLLSIDKGHGFQWFLRRVDELGYFGAWASLDAQYFGVAQRRKRVFFVGHIGDWRYPAAVLLEPQSLCGNHPPRREARETLAGTLTSSLGKRCGQPNDDNPSDYLIASEIAGTLPAGGNSTGGPRQPGMGAETAASGYLVAHALRADGFDASEDGTGTPLVAFDCKASGRSGFGVGDIASTSRAMGHSGSHQNGGGQQAVAFGSAVRRLTPRECERLQGFPDDYTAITYRKKSAADGSRYKALGNSMAVPVMRWILSRIEAVNALGVPT